MALDVDKYWEKLKDLELGIINLSAEIAEPAQEEDCDEDEREMRMALCNILRETRKPLVKLFEEEEDGQ